MRLLSFRDQHNLQLRRERRVSVKSSLPAKGPSMNMTVLVDGCCARQLDRDRDLAETEGTNGSRPQGRWGRDLKEQELFAGRIRACRY